MPWKQNFLSSPHRQVQVFPQYLECSTITTKLTCCIYLYRKENGRKTDMNVILKFWDSVCIHWNVTVSGMSAFRFNSKAFNHSANCFMITGSHNFMWTTLLCMNAMNVHFLSLYPTNNGTVIYWDMWCLDKFITYLFYYNKTN